MLAKRLFKKKSFIVILCLLPAFAALISFASKQDNGMLTVMLAADDAEDKTASEIIDYLVDSDSIILYRISASPDEAIEKVKYGKADAAWVICEDIDDKITEFGKDKSKVPSLVSIYIRDDSVLLKLSREKLYDALYPHISYAVYENYVYDKLGDAEKPDRETLKKIYHDSWKDNNIVEYKYLDSDGEGIKEVNYLTSPLRGMLAIITVLCTLASSLYCLGDEKKGFFSRIPESRRYYIFFMSNLSASFIASAVMAVSVFFAGTAVSVGREILISVLFSVCSASFCTMLCRIFRTPFSLGAMIPPTALAMAVLSPIFIDFEMPFNFGLLFPSTYLLNSVHNNRYLLYMLVYSAAVFILGIVSDIISRYLRPEVN